MPNQQRIERLRRLSPLEAVQAWLDGAFGIGEESALYYAIRKDPRIDLSDDQIDTVMMDAISGGDRAQACLARLVTHSEALRRTSR